MSEGNACIAEPNLEVFLMAALRADVLFGFLIIYLVIYVKKLSFVVPDGVSITVGKEDLYNIESFICSSL